MKQLITLISLTLLTLTGCGEKSADSGTDSTAYQCPTVEEDNCMTEDLYQECLDVLASCDSGNIVVAESCPYASFGCME